MGFQSYDAWRLTPPWDAPRKADRFTPDTVTAPLEIDLGEGFLDTVATYEADSGALISVVIEGRDVPAAAIEAFIGPAAWARIEAIGEDELADLCADAAADAAGDYADYIRDMRDF